MDALEERQLDELAEVLRRRYTEARKAGLEHEDAIKWARSNGDIGHLRKLFDGGCPPRILKQIIL
jgi:hypothetical protein